jgi:hypothetical protein
MGTQRLPVAGGASEPMDGEDHRTGFAVGEPRGVREALSVWSGEVSGGPRCGGMALNGSDLTAADEDQC